MRISVIEPSSVIQQANQSIVKDENVMPSLYQKQDEPKRKVK